MWRFGICLFLVGCATSAPMPDSQFFIECDGAGVPWSACFKEAAKVCPNGYELLSQGNGQSPYVGAANQDSAVLGAVERKNITVKCR